MNRIYEPSTWAGLAVMFQAMKAFLPAYVELIDVGTVAAGSMAVVMRERGGGDAN